MTTRPKRRWYGVMVACEIDVMKEKIDPADGLVVEMYAAGDIRTWRARPTSQDNHTPQTRYCLRVSSHPVTNGRSHHEVRPRRGFGASPGIWAVAQAW
ncbi:hypothetical protein N7448_003214 [Penicillium atrosanguineum]|nr:hypothetical protein N7448_003214 [Penicillium atrosanguineum]